MTGPELKALLLAVEAAGGPITLSDTMSRDTYLAKFANQEGYRGGDHVELSNSKVITRPGYVLVGVLKRDLIERGMRYSTLSGPDNYAMTAFRSSLGPGLQVGAWSANELEAVLETWLAAAKAEHLEEDGA
jgi:hypothetical protein